MAHEFQSGLFFGEKAWHGLGTTLPDDSNVRHSIDEAIKIAGLDWSVGLMPVTVEGNVIESHRAIVRQDTRQVLGVVGNRYTPLQNRDQFDWFKPYLDSGECSFETCGALKGGALVWVLARINRNDSDIGGGDMVRKYLLLTSSHDGSKATSAGFCPIRVVCWNTLSRGLNHSDSQFLKVPHTKSQHKALATIRDTINLVDQSFEATADQYRTMLRCKVDRDGIRKYVKLVLELPDDEKDISTKMLNRVDDIVSLCVNGEGNNGDSAWSAYNGVTQFLTHNAGRTPDSRLRSAWYGDNKRVNDRAFSLALQLAA